MINIEEKHKQYERRSDIYDKYKKSKYTVKEISSIYGVNEKRIYQIINYYQRNNLFVYVLVDPRDDKVYYVGCSHKPKSRLLAICPKIPERLHSQKTHIWNTELRNLGKEPYLRVIQQVSPDNCEFQEQKWINYFKKLNPGLLNEKEVTYHEKSNKHFPVKRGIYYTIKRTRKEDK